jgi:hypothetical protein
VSQTGLSITPIDSARAIRPMDAEMASCVANSLIAGDGFGHLFRHAGSLK